MHRRTRILFICKRRDSYWGHDPAEDPGKSLSSGLRNSVSFVADMLNGVGIEAQQVEVTDNNDIDREVTAFRPTHVFIEAFWVVPEKFDVLKALHPHVRWIVRSHSETPFLSQEGIALEWVAGYLGRDVELNCNSPRARLEMRAVAHAMGVNENLVTYLPNYYPVPGHRATDIHRERHDSSIHVGCFGAIRPLKNQLQQAIAAMCFADDARLGMKFHINATRVEGNAQPVLKNLRALFANATRHELVEEPWVEHQAFLEVVDGMDMALQVSFSETFNIVSADAVQVGVPVIVSPEVSWLGEYAQASPYDAGSIVGAMWAVWDSPLRRRLFAQRRDLSAFCERSERAWLERFGH